MWYIVRGFEKINAVRVFVGNDPGSLAHRAEF
jgi:hypothetical protein